jgi:predicted N-acyltransferase
MDTGARKWGSPYLNRETFSLLGERIADDILLVFAEEDGYPIAGALNMIGGDRLLGRYWGTTSPRPMLHFETCYYQAIDFAIAHDLKTVEAGAQGGHKLARGYVPSTTYSAHWIAHEGLAQAVEEYLGRERQMVEKEADFLKERTPFKKDG